MTASEYKHRARKRFGQNFLTDEHIIDHIIHAIGPLPLDNIVEIGPGQGALTQPLMAASQQLHAIEVDRDLARLLTAQFADSPGFVLHVADALDFDFSQLATKRPLRIVGNLPYNISTPLIFHLLKFDSQINDMHFMLQKEVVERLAAKPGNKIYGRLSVVVQYYCQVDYLFTVPPDAFTPAPKVESAIVHLTPHTQKPHTAQDPFFFSHLVKLCFQQRRKTLRNTLKQLSQPISPQHLSVDLNLRPENLSVEDFVRLSNELISHHDNP